jgi:hypothetical protein
MTLELGDEYFHDNCEHSLHSHFQFARTLSMLTKLLRCSSFHPGIQDSTLFWTGLVNVALDDVFVALCDLNSFSNCI